MAIVRITRQLGREGLDEWSCQSVLVQQSPAGTRRQMLRELGLPGTGMPSDHDDVLHRQCPFSPASLYAPSLEGNRT